MSLVMPKETGGDFELVPAGTFAATCYRVIDLGTQQVEWQGKVKNQKKVMLSWEMTDEKMTDGRPFAMHQRYTLSSSDKSALRRDLESWRGRPFTEEELGKFDISNLLGKACLLGIVHEPKNGKTYANLSSILRLPKGMTATPAINNLVQFDLSNFDKAVYESLSDSLRAVIAKSPEYQELMGAHRISEIADELPRDDAPDPNIPF